MNITKKSIIFMNMIHVIDFKYAYCRSFARYMKRSLLLFIFAFSFVVAQDPAEYNKVYSRTYIEIAPKSIDQALKIADSLYEKSEDRIFKTRSLMLSATLYQQKGDINKAVEYALRSEKIINETNDFSWKSRVYGFLASQYRFLKLNEKSREYALKAIEQSGFIEDKEKANSTIGLIYQELAHSAIDQERYQEARSYVLQSQKHFAGVKQNREALLGHNQQLLGLIDYKEGKIPDAIQHYKSGLNITKATPAYYIRALIFSGLTRIYLDNKDLKTAKIYLDEAKKIASQTEYLEVKRDYEEAAASYFAASNDLKSMLKVIKNKDSLGRIIDDKAQHFLSKEFNNLEDKNVRIEKGSSVKNIFIYTFGGLLLVALLVFGWIKIKQKRDIKRFEDLIERVRNEKIYEMNGDSEKDEKPVDYQGFSIPQETEQRLLQQLENFENSVLYTQKNMSLSVLAGLLETNTKYLSYVINNHKKKSFQHYINGLRIQYIIQKLKNDPVYRQYKIAVLSEESGFSSPNKFSMVFKKFTEITPSQFIKYLDETKVSNN